MTEPTDTVAQLELRLHYYMTEVEIVRDECATEIADLSRKIAVLIAAGDDLETALRRAVRDLSGLVIDPLLGPRNLPVIESWAAAKKGAGE